MGNTQRQQPKLFKISREILKLINRLPIEENVWRNKGANYTVDELIKTCWNTAKEFGWNPLRFGEIHAERRLGHPRSCFGANTFILFLKAGHLITQETNRKSTCRYIEALTCVCSKGEVTLICNAQDYIVIMLE